MAKAASDHLVELCEDAPEVPGIGIIGEGLTAHREALREMTELLHHESPSVRQGAGGVEAASKPTGSYVWAACTRSPPARWRDAIVRRRAALGPPPH